MSALASWGTCSSAGSLTAKRKRAVIWFIWCSCVDRVEVRRAKKGGKTSRLLRGASDLDRDCLEGSPSVDFSLNHSATLFVVVYALSSKLCIATRSVVLSQSFLADDGESVALTERAHAACARSAQIAALFFGLSHLHRSGAVCGAILAQAPGVHWRNAMPGIEAHLGEGGREEPVGHATAPFMQGLVGRPLAAIVETVT